MSKKQILDFQNLPRCACDYIELVIKKMKYRKKVRQDVANELIAHFQDELRDCKDEQEREQRAIKLIEEFGDAKMLGILMRRAKKRCRPLWRTMVVRAFQVLGILILCQIVYVIWFLSGRPVITTDYVAQLNKMVQPTADESLNAATLYSKAIELYKECPNDIKGLINKTPFDSNITSEQKLLIEKWVSDNNEAVDLIIAGNQRPYYWEEYKASKKDDWLLSILLPQLSSFRGLAYVLCQRAFIEAEKGRYENAFDDLISCYRLGNHIKKGPCIIEQLVGIAIRSLSVGRMRIILNKYRISLPLLVNLQNNLTKEIADDDFVINIDAEKLMIYDSIQRCFTEGKFDKGHLYLQNLFTLNNGFIGTTKIHGDLTLLGAIFSDPNNMLMAGHVLFTHPNKQETITMANQLYDTGSKLMLKSPAQLRNENIDLESDLMKSIKGNLLLQILMPAFNNINKLMWRSKIDAEATLAIIATLRYQKDTGNYPEDLQEVVKAGYLKGVPVDPFSDRPLIYKKTPNGFTVYSVGFNFTDDGGVMGKTDNKVQLWANDGDAVFWPAER